MRLQRGQSMTEFAAGAAVMALLLLGSITIGGYQEVQRRMAIAARQMAFEGMWIGTRAGRAEQLRHIGEFHLDDTALTDAAGRGRYVQSSDIAITLSAQPVPGLAHEAAVAMVAPLRVVGSFLGGGFDLDVDGLESGVIDVDIAPASYRPQPFDTLELRLRQPFSLLTDAWNAAGASHVRSRTAGLVPTSTLSRLQEFWRPLLLPLSLVEPSLSRLCLGIVEADRIPADRLGPGRTPLPGRCP